MNRPAPTATVPIRACPVRAFLVRASLVRIFLVLSVMVPALTGCSGIRNDYPEKTTFRLPPPAILPVKSPGAKEKVPALLVKQLGISPEFESDAFVYRTGRNRFRSDFYHSFLTPPARMISDLVQEALYASGSFTQAAPNAPADVRYQLRGKIIDLYADLRGEAPFKAVISIRLILDAVTGVGFDTVIRKVYKQEIPFDTLDPDLYIDSLNRGLALILGNFYADIEEEIK